MKNNEVENLLESTGLSKSEAKLYLTCLSLGPSSAIQLGQRLNLTRQMVYTILPFLMDKGLVKQVKIGTRNLYQAIGPEVLKERTKSIEKKIEEIIPILKSRQAENNAVPLITVYENPLSMREWYKNFMKEAKDGEDFLVWSTGKTSFWYEIDKEFNDEYLAFAEKHKINMKIVMPKSVDSNEHKKLIGNRKNIRYKTSLLSWGGGSEKWVWRNQVCYQTLRENASNLIVIESKTLADLERFDFEMIWGALK